LLEAIVAMVIVGAALLPLLSFISQAARQLTAVADANERSLAMENALALVEPINPMAEPQGQIALDRNHTLLWRSEEIVTPKPQVLVGAGLAAYKLGLYRMEVTISRDGASWFSFDVRKVGYERHASEGSFTRPDVP
jgi:hypothetical protein